MVVAPKQTHGMGKIKHIEVMMKVGRMRILATNNPTLEGEIHRYNSKQYNVGNSPNNKSYEWTTNLCKMWSGGSYAS